MSERIIYKYRCPLTFKSILLLNTIENLKCVYPSNYYLYNKKLRSLINPKQVCFNKKKIWALTEWLSWLERPSVNGRVAGLIPGQGLCVGCWFDPQLGPVRGRQLGNVSHFNVSLSPFLPL